MVPKLGYDDCHLCPWSATFAVRRGDVQPVRLSPVQDGESRLGYDERDRLPDGYEECAQLITEREVDARGPRPYSRWCCPGNLPLDLSAFSARSTRTNDSARRRTVPRPTIVTCWRR